jgi:hypothetical protein
MKLRHPIALIAALLVTTSSIARVDGMPQGTVTLTKARGDALVVWDATDELASLVSAKSTRKATLERLASDAALIYGDRAPALKKTARSLMVLVLYTKTGAISPTYHTATFEGVERLLSVKAQTADYKHAAQWSQSLAAGKTPAGVSLTIIGQLPPELQ